MLDFPRWKVLFLWLVTLAAALSALQPNADLLRALITLKGRADPAITGAIRQIARLCAGNVRAAQRTGTKLVDIDYDITGIATPCIVILEIS